MYIQYCKDIKKMSKHDLHLDVLLFTNQKTNKQDREHFFTLTLKKKFSEKTLRNPTCLTSRILNR